MSTGHGPTRKADGSNHDHIEELTDLLVDADSQKISLLTPKSVDEALDISIETPGPASLSGFMPPPPSPGPGVEDSDSGLDANAASNLAYEDLLAKLVLPSSRTPSVVTAETPPPSPFIAPPTPGVVSPLGMGMGSASASASSSDERTLVTQNPLLAEEQETAAREGLSSPREEYSPTLPSVALSNSAMQSSGFPVPVAPVTFQPSAPVSATSNRPVGIYVLLGSILVILATILAILMVKFVFSGPSAPSPTIATPEPPPTPAAAVPAVPPPSKAAESPKAEPAAAQAEATEPEPEAPTKAAPAAEPVPTAEPTPAAKPEPAAEAQPEEASGTGEKASSAKASSKSRRSSSSSSSHSRKETKAKEVKPKETKAKEAKPVAPAPAPKPKASRSSKSSSWADPFAN